MKLFIQQFTTLMLVIVLTACSAATASTEVITAAQSNKITASSSETNFSSTATSESVSIDQTENSKTHDDPEDTVYDISQSVAITLNGDSISSDGTGVSITGTTATITAAGTYTISGQLNDGQIVVNSTSDEIVRLVLNGAEIHSSTSAPVYIKKAEKVIIVLADNSQNVLTDGQTYIFDIPEDEEPSAAIFSKDDLTITGNGSLNVTANFRDGIKSKDGLVIDSGNITVQAADDGIEGKDYLLLKDGNITVNAQDDGLKSDNDTDADKGFITIKGGTIQVNAGGDAISAETDITVSGGTFNLTSGGGSSQRADETTSAKGIKGGNSVVIESGSFNINSADDTIHSNDSITIRGGSFQLSTADDGIHADNSLTIDGGELLITQSYESIESAVITINDGKIDITSSDDGINVSGGRDGSGTNGGNQPGNRPGFGGPGQDFFGASSDSYFLYINGGEILVNARGDGVDVNGTIEMTGGLLVVSGPTERMNGALDYDRGFTLTGGTIVAAGSSGMAMAPDQSSSQPSVLIYFSATQPGGSPVNIQDSTGKNILTFVPAKDYQSLAFSSAALTNGETYTVSIGGSVTGSETGGLYQDGVYTSGTQYTTFTLSGAVTVVGNGGQMGGGGSRRP